jgi:hypothetical protein
MNAYHFTTRWRINASCERVYRILEDVASLPDWWPSVYLDVKVLEKGQPGGVGKVVALYTKGWLPYTLRWQFRVTSAEFPTGFSLEAWGDFVGKGIWTFRPVSDEWSEVIYDWEITAEKPLLKKLSWLLRPVFSANHHWAMRMGEKSLKLEIMRREAATAEARQLIPEPPKALFAPRKTSL